MVDEATGEILFEAGVTLSFDQAMQIQEAGVKEAFIKAETKEYFVTESGENEIRFVEKEVKVIGNGMVDINKYVSFDCEELGISERYAMPYSVRSWTAQQTRTNCAAPSASVQMNWCRSTSSWMISMLPSVTS